MTDIGLETRTCAICGSAEQYRVLRSTTSGSPDLDLRPGERYPTISMWVQHCSHCDYCARDISKSAPNAGDVMRSDRFQHTRVDDRLPELAKSFLLQALLQENMDRRSAAMARLHAGWVCDDEGLASLAVECRTLAVDDMVSTGSFNDTEEGIDDGMVYVDMLRRIGRFAAAIEVIGMLLSRSSAIGVRRRVLDYQQSLCEDGNSERKTLHDVPTT